MIGGINYEKIKNLVAMCLAAVMVLCASSICVFALDLEDLSKTAMSNSEEYLTFTVVDENGNEVETIPLTKTEMGWEAFAQITRARASYPIWNLSSSSFSDVYNDTLALQVIPYRFTASSNKTPYMVVNLTGVNCQYAQVSINNVTNGKTYVGSVSLSKSGNFFSTSGYVNGMTANNYYQYAVSVSPGNFTYLEFNLR